MINIYEGTLGSFQDTDKLETELNRYLAKTNENLSYEIKEDRTRIIIITGKNDDEKDIELFQHPFIFKTIRGEEAIALDMRPFMKHKLDDMVNILDKLQDKYNGVLQLQRLVYTKLILDDKADWLTYVKPQLTEAFSSIITTTTTMMVFDRTIQDAVAIMAKLHFTSMDDEDKHNKLSDYITRLNRKDINELTHGDLKELYGYLTLAYAREDLVLPSRSIGSLTRNIKLGIMSGRGEGLTADLYVQTLGRGFFSLDSKNLAIGMTEHLPTFMAIIVSVMLEGVNSKSTFRKILEGNKRNVKGKELAVQLLEVYENEIA
jgi:hypothetical protein